MISDFTFRDELNQAPLNIPRAALRFAEKIAYPGLKVDHFIARLDQLAAWGSKLISPTRSVSAQSVALADFLFHRFSFQGNTANYSDPRNSYLNEVLERRLGIPISLSVIYVAVAERLGLPARGIGLPGHFIVGIHAPEGELYLDPFNGGKRLTQYDCIELVQTTTGYSGPFRPEWLEPTSPPDILARMLNNLKNIYVLQENWPLAQAVLEHLRMVQPDSAEHIRDLGLVHSQNGSLRLAVHFLEKYLTLAPDASDGTEVRRSLEIAVQKLARLN